MKVSALFVPLKYSTGERGNCCDQTWCATGRVRYRSSKLMCASLIVVPVQSPTVAPALKHVRIVGVPFQNF